MLFHFFFITDLELIMSLYFSIMHKSTHIMRKIFKNNTENGNENLWTNKQIKQISLFCILNGKLRALLDMARYDHSMQIRAPIYTKFKIDNYCQANVTTWWNLFKKNTGRKFIFREKTPINIKLKILFFNIKLSSSSHIREDSATANLSEQSR